MLRMKRSLSLAVGILAFFCLIFPWAHFAHSLELKVTVKGVEGKVRKNILAGLKIYTMRKEPNLTKGEVSWLLREASGNIKSALETFGYYSPQVMESVETIEDGLKVVYTIEPGQPAIIEKVGISIVGAGKDLLEVQRGIATFPLKTGDVLQHELYLKGKRRLVDDLYSLGFLDATFIQSEIRIHRRQGRVDIALVLESGPRFFFGKTQFTQDVIDPDLLQRFIHYKEGEPYSTQRLMELRHVLVRTDYFGRVDIRGAKDQVDGKLVPVSISLAEPPYYNQYKVGVGYATDTGLHGRLEWDNRLFNRHGHTVGGSLKVAEQEKHVSFSYRIPMFDPRYDKLILGGSWEDEEWEETETRVFKVGMSLEHRGSQYKYGAQLDVQGEKYSIVSEKRDSTLLIPGFYYSLVTTEEVIDTDHGAFFSVNLKGAKEGFISDTDFLQGKIGGKLIVTPMKKWRLISRFTLGGTLVNSIDDLPPSLRYYAGGDQSVRGYGYKELGPKDSNGNVIGGKYLVVGSVEAERLLEKNWSLAAFIDAGNAMNDTSFDVKKGAGVGVRYRLPFGQIRVDVATALSESEYPFRLHLAVGGDL